MIPEKAIQYAITEFERAIRIMSATRRWLHAFEISEKYSCLIILAPTATIERLSKHRQPEPAHADQPVKSYEKPQ